MQSCWYSEKLACLFVWYFLTTVYYRKIRPPYIDFHSNYILLGYISKWKCELSTGLSFFSLFCCCFSAKWVTCLVSASTLLNIVNYILSLPTVSAPRRLPPAHPPERPAAPAESGAPVAGRSLWPRRRPGLRRDRGPALANPHAEDGGQIKAG